MTDITYIRTHEGFAYLAVVIDLYSRRVVGLLSHMQACAAGQRVDAKSTANGIGAASIAHGGVAKKAKE